MFTEFDMIDNQSVLTNYIEWRHQCSDVTSNRFRLEFSIFRTCEYNNFIVRWGKTRSANYWGKKSHLYFKYIHCQLSSEIDLEFLFDMSYSIYFHIETFPQLLLGHHNFPQNLLVVPLKNSLNFRFDSGLASIL